jgi:cytochrome b subunit of formate dehydrogenase
MLLIGTTFYAFAGAPETKKRIAMYSGMAALLIVLTGVRMWQAQFGFALAGWIVLKLICWLGISAMSGLAYRRREQVRLWITLTCLFSAVAVIMAYVKPF